MNPNLPTIITLAVTALLLGAIIAIMIVRRKKGKTGCSCGCSGCAMRDMCHSQETEENNQEK